MALSDRADEDPTLPGTLTGSPPSAAPFGRSRPGAATPDTARGGDDPWCVAPFLALSTGTEGWRWRAACADSGDVPFFAPDREQAKARVSRIARAKAICARCPVMAQCRAYALQFREPFGIWGGLSEDERDQSLSIVLRDNKPHAHPTPLANGLRVAPGIRTTVGVR